jgi:hypothetical protein
VVEIVAKLAEAGIEDFAYQRHRIGKLVTKSGSERVVRLRRGLRETTAEYWERLTGRPDAADVVRRYFLD